VFLAYDNVPAGPIGIWSATAPNQFTTSLARESAIDIAAASDGTIFASRTSTSTEIRGADLTLTAILPLLTWSRFPLESWSPA